MSKKERFNEAYRFLRSKGAFHTQKEAASLVKTTESNMSNALKGLPRVLTDNFIVRFCDAFGEISLNWLMTGEGEMLTKTTSSNGETINNSIQSPIVHGTMENAYNGMSGIAGDENSIYVKLLEENRELRVTNAKLLKIIDNLTSKTP